MNNNNSDQISFSQTLQCNVTWKMSSWFSKDL